MWTVKIPMIICFSAHLGPYFPPLGGLQWTFPWAAASSTTSSPLVYVEIAAVEEQLGGRLTTPSAPQAAFMCSPYSMVNSSNICKASMWVPSEVSQCEQWEKPDLRANSSSQAGISVMHPQLYLCQCLGIKQVIWATLLIPLLLRMWA